MPKTETALDKYTPADPNAPIDDADIGRVAEALGETEDMWSKIASMSTPTIQCPTCGGAGTMVAGSLGEYPCEQCHGQREVEHPLAADLGKLALPDFEGSRKKVHLLGQALDQSRLATYRNTVAVGEGRPGDVVPVPPVPTKGQLADIERAVAGLTEHVRDQAKMLSDKPRRQSRREIKTGAKAAALKSGPTFTDADLDDLEDDANDIG